VLDTRTSGQVVLFPQTITAGIGSIWTAGVNLCPWNRCILKIINLLVLLTVLMVYYTCMMVEYVMIISVRIPQTSFVLRWVWGGALPIVLLALLRHPIRVDILGNMSSE